MDKKIIFVTGTGRCGTKSVADLFKEIGGYKSLHEPNPQPIQQYLNALSGKKIVYPDEKMKFRIKGSKNHYVECNARLLPFIDQLKKEYPDCRVVVLVRDGRDFVRSAFNRPFVRSGFLPPQLENTKPSNVTDLFEKLCWLWSYLMKITLIQNYDHLFKIEGLKAEKLLRVLQLPQTDKEIPVANTTFGYALPHWTKWTEDQKRKASYWMKELLDKFGYKW